MHALKPGDTLEITQPLQNFPLRVGAARYVLLAGGIGITAIVEHGRACFATSRPTTRSSTPAAAAPPWPT